MSWILVKVLTNVSTKDKIKKTKEEKMEMTKAETVGAVTHTHTHNTFIK